MHSARLARLVFVFAFACGWSGHALLIAQERSARFDEEEAFRVQVQIIVKQFWIAARQHHGDKMRDTIDPDYIANHELDRGEFKFPEIATSNLYDLQVANDKSTVLCQIEKDSGTTAIVLLRLVKRGDQLFVQPPNPPATESRVVVPWLLHAKLAA